MTPRLSAIGGRNFDQEGLLTRTRQEFYDTFALKSEQRATENVFEHSLIALINGAILMGTQGRDSIKS